MKKCKLCGKKIVLGKMAQAPDGYVCEDCIDYMARHELIDIDAVCQCENPHPYNDMPGCPKCNPYMTIDK